MPSCGIHRVYVDYFPVCVMGVGVGSMLGLGWLMTMCWNPQLIGELPVFMERDVVSLGVLRLRDSMNDSNRIRRGWCWCWWRARSYLQLFGFRWRLALIVDMIEDSVDVE